MGCTFSSNAGQSGTQTEYTEHVLSSRWQLGKELGKGAFGRVVLATSTKIPDKVAAIKIMSKHKMKPDDVAAIKQEVDIMRKLQHRNIVKFFDFFDEDGEMYVVLEYLKGGELFTRLQRKEVYSEKDARDLVFILLNALKHMHDLDIVHRDLKPENLLLTCDSNDADVKIADFGFAAYAPTPILTETCGTPAYVAPEVLSAVPYGKAADMWSLGVITYILLGGYAPFDGGKDTGMTSLFKQIKAARYKFHDEYWCDVSATAKDFIRHLLVVDPQHRLTANQAMSHPWLLAAADSLLVIKLTKAMENFKTFEPKSKLRTAMKAVVATNRIKRGSHEYSTRSEEAALFRDSEGINLEFDSAHDVHEHDVYVEHKFAQRWVIGEHLGEGAFAEVKLCTSIKEPHRICAVKILSKRKMKQDDHDSVKKEVDIMRKLHHPNIVQFMDFFDEGDHMYIVIEYLSGGELFDKIVQKSHYSEKEARDTIFIFLNALKHCHDKGIVHRDLKPENLLLATKGDDENVKIADFGLSAVDNGGHLKEVCGSPSYMAPEILSHKPYGKPVDMWALGVIAYIILGGYPPFDQDDEDSVKACKYEFHTDYWSHVSPHAKQFIQGLITLDPKARLTVDDALNHIWVKTAARDLAGRNLAQSLKKFKEFNSKRKLKGAIKGVMLANRLRNSVHALSEGR